VILTRVAVWGAGQLGGTVARRLADGAIARQVILVDEDVGTANGKALDIAQACAVEGIDCSLHGVAGIEDAGPVDLVIVADPPGTAGRELSPNLAGDLARALLPAVGRGTLLVADLSGAAILEAAVQRGLPRSACLGSAPVALAAALRRRLAAELEVEPREIAASVLGHPPDHLVLPRGAATLSGVPIDQVSVARRALDALRGQRPGPVSLAAAVARTAQALAGRRTTVLPVWAVLDGEYGRRGVALAVPAKLRSGRLEAVVECALDPVDRVVFDTGAERRSATRAATR
jgi:malate dehydrogenase